jgi:serine/threonine-protein kinase
VPNVVGLTFTDAQTQLQQAGFKVARRDEISDQPINQVIRQTPEAGLLYGKGRTVIVYVSSLQVTIPDVHGQTFEQADTALRKLNLVAVRVDQDVPNVAPGTVVSTTPPAGTKVDKGTQVQVVVAREPPVPLPNVVGKDQVTATQILQAAGFQPFIVPTPSATVPAGTVVTTNPAPNTPTPKGTQVQVMVSTGPQTSTVPGVTGQQRDAAAAQLTSAGFNVIVNNCPMSSSIVVSQNPAGGSSAPPGSQVTISCA